MKKHIFSILILIVSIFILKGIALADAQLPYVTDTVGLLSVDECQALENTAQTISERYDCGVYLIIVDDYTTYAGSDDGMYEFAKYLYQSYTLGMGTDRSGELLVMSMNDRMYGLIAYGSVGNGAFTDYGKECMEDAFVADFKNDDWIGGFETYLAVSEIYLRQYSQGVSFDVGQSLEDAQQQTQSSQHIDESTRQESLWYQQYLEKAQTETSKPMQDNLDSPFSVADNGRSEMHFIGLLRCLVIGAILSFFHIT